MNASVKNKIDNNPKRAKNINSSPMEGCFNFVSLEIKVRYTLGKNDRLKSRKAIEHLFAKGNSFSISPLRILYTLSPAVTPAANTMNLQVGFAVSSRNFKKAVDRNRVKRLMREAWRLQKNELQLSPLLASQSLQLFLIYTGKELPEYNLIFEKTALVITRLLKLADGKK
jgi:ribonuclease P protein component